MSQGKYSPTMCVKRDVEYIYNAYGKPCAEWSREVEANGVVYDEKTMFGNYDSEGFDGYGYSAFDSEGTYVGIGTGIDRLGYTENEYMCMSIEDFCDIRDSVV